MRTLTLIAIAAMSMWITDQTNAQQQNTQAEKASGAPGQGQIESQKEGKSRRGKRGKGMDQQQGRRGGAQMLDGLFTRFDQDKNGSISLEEAPERMKNQFKGLDTNGDEAISKEELQAAFEKKGRGKGKDGAGRGKGKKGQGKMMDPVKLIESMDKNNDGVLSSDEAPEKMRKRFDQIDADSSGTVSADELKASFEKKKKGGKGKSGQLGRNKSADKNTTKPVEPKRPPMAKDGT